MQLKADSARREQEAAAAARNFAQAPEGMPCTCPPDWPCQQRIAELEAAL